MLPASRFPLPALFLPALFLLSTPALAQTLTYTGQPTFYRADRGSTNVAGSGFVSYQFTATSACADVWVRLNSISGLGGNLALASSEDGLFRIGPMTAAQTKAAFFYLSSTGTSTVSGTFSTSAFCGKPGVSGTTTLTTLSTTISAIESTQEASPQTIISTLVCTSPQVGGICTLSVVSDQGNMGGSSVMAWEPASAANWPADTFELFSTTINVNMTYNTTTKVCSTTASSFTLTDDLYDDNTQPPALNGLSGNKYCAQYFFRLKDSFVNPSAIKTSVLLYANSGGQIKFTGNFDDPLFALTVPNTTNIVTLSKSVSPTTALSGPVTVTYTVTIQNTTGGTVYLDSIKDVLPTSPATPSYVTNTSTFAGSSIPNPTLSGSTLTWNRLFAVPNGGTTLTYQVSFPDTQGTYVNSVTALIGNTVIDTSVDTSVNNPATATFTIFSASISGKVFEDVNYGGGAGRDLATSGGAVRSAARVELYNSSGNFVTSTTTNASGDYSFSTLGAGNYTVRVVNSTVTSSRPGYVAGLLPVQTYRTDASSSTALADVNRVGGEAPDLVDAGNGSTTLAALTTATTTAQSIAPVTISTANISGVDFGFNFDTIVSTRNSGQGSLRQFILNANALGDESLLDQSGSRKDASNLNQALPSDKESSIFMIPDGLAHPGLRSGLVGQLTTGVAIFNITTALPALNNSTTAANARNTVIDGTTQTVNVGDTNAGQLGAGGPVGLGPDGRASSGDETTLLKVYRPEVQIVDASAGGLTLGIDIQANSNTVRGIAIYGFGSGSVDGNIRIGTGSSTNYSGTLIEQNILGTSATAFTDPGASRTQGDNVVAIGADSGVIKNNLVGYTEGFGILLIYGATGWTVEHNEARGNAINNSNRDGISVEETGTTGNTVRYNLSIQNEGIGIDTYNNTGANTISENSVIGNGFGNGNAASVPNETPGIRVYGVGSLISRNLVNTNYGAGVMVVATASQVTISQNSIYASGSIAGEGGSAASNQIGIDLLSSGDSQQAGTLPFVTLNDSSDSDTGGNALFNYPVLETAEIQGSNLVIKGWARPGSLIELFIANPDPSGFGEGQTYLISRTEGSSVSGQADGDATSSAYGPGAVNGIAQGQDNTNRFSFTIPLASLSTVAVGTKLTATATCLSANGCSSAASGSTSEFSGLVTVTASGVSVSGTIYHDLQPNTAREPSEDWTTGTSVYVNLVQSGSVVQSVQVNAGTGDYSFSLVATGSYSIVVTNTVTSVGATAPTGWLFINPNGSLNLSVFSSNITGQDFGLYHGSKFSGTIFYDDGLSSGTANDALQNGGEPGIGNLSVTASDGSTAVSTLTNGSGSYTLYVPYTFGSGVTLSHSQNPATGTNIAGGSVVLAGSFNDALARQRSISFASGQYFDGYNFGVVRPSAWKPNRSGQVTSPGTIAYSHLYQPGTLGTLSLSESGGDFGYEVRLDANCNGTFEASEAFQTSLSLNVNSTWPREGDGSLKTCVVEVRVNVAAGEPDSSVDIAQIVADLSWAGNSSVVNSRTLTDTTTVVEASTLSLSKGVRNVTQGTAFAANNQAKPEDVLEYRISYQNIGTQPIHEVELLDPVPFYSDLELNVYAGTEVQLQCPNGTVVNIETGVVANILLNLATHCTLSTAPHPNGTGSAEALLPSEEGYFLYRVRVR